MNILENTEPKEVFGFFEQISSIPRSSRHTEAISKFLCDFAKERGLEYYTDKMNNVIIKKPASEGFENSAPVILQGHTDMVAQKESDCNKDMEKEGLDLFIDGDLLGARGTTLGADDGIAVAMMLAVLDSKTIKHPPVEAIFTSDEEIGLLGANDLDASPVKGKRLINIDSEEEGILTVGCAGGNLTEIALPVTREAFKGEGMRIAVNGLLGGHSGVEVDKGRANADIVLGRLLSCVRNSTDMRICTVSGGLKDNAIPQNAEAYILVASFEEAEKALKVLTEKIKNEYRTPDPDLKVDIEKADCHILPMTKDSTAKVVAFLTTTPNGLQEMSPEVKGFPQTSLNLGILECSENAVCASYCVRSGVQSQREMLNDTLTNLTEMLGGSIRFEGDYPPWEYRKDSPLRDLMIETFKEEYGREPEVTVIHAGLECGILSEKIEGLDCVSIGPEMQDVHTPRERLSISSTQRVWKYLLKLLEKM